ncbi:ATP-grasp domain-containing protein [Pseudalkalibacillus hwajinpoensis]|uniref:Carbamoyl-phosphate synthase large subunit n=1 Tax=Guptibacillus hwajinpoensis TaxID=208199 RepID=A0A4U1MDQ1_9BACL|nr:ATP-grasp domain-containing protein [Pseudalkalibacillus hwajinpoensis]TKD68260.1 carbamoyl-phosphate synthase large subunit [Pseudalkalibacillus hwajinpoensis]
MSKIWFNRWFTTVAHYIELIRNNEDGAAFEIYGSHPNEDALYLQYCDHAFVEPDISGEAYIDYCLSVCKEKKIDLFIPRKENVLISQNLSKFHEIGVKVLVCNAELMALMDNKAAMYHSIIEREKEKGIPLVPIPDYAVVTNVHDFRKAYSDLTKKGHTVCFKPVIGEGANGFRVIKEGQETIEELLTEGVSRRISFEYACSILSQKDTFPDLMVLEYLDGYEYSIDCLAYDGELHLAIPRKKAGGRIRELEENQELLDIARALHREYSIDYISNIQVKFSKGVPKLLEINPRMAGGLNISCLSGVNIPYEAIKLLLHGNSQIEEFKPTMGIRASHIEKEIVLT